MSGSTAQSEDLSSSILDFQANYIRLTHRRKITPVDLTNETHANILNYLWMSSKMEPETGPLREVFKWRLLGFESENVTDEFNDVGMLGLDCLVRIVLAALLISPIDYLRFNREFWSLIIRISSQR